LQLAARAADDVLAGHAAPWIELRRAGLGAFDRLRLYRKPLNGALAAAAVLLLAIAGAMFMRAHQHAQHERDDHLALTESFKKAFPGWEVPANIGAVIASEHRRIGGKSSSALPPGWDDSALITLHRVLDKLPADMSYDLQRMTFADRSFELHGRLRSYEDADKLAAAARAAGLNVTPPQTRREADGFWSFTLRAEKPAAPPPALARQD
jgi:pilus assembly protein HofN